ncbi:hypothetical protein PTI98_010171 [Pleurotus ostreatus]|nr:hypothetical protein PTI98_010171 [Pleurotus ostreatus]
MQFTLRLVSVVALATMVLASPAYNRDVEASIVSNAELDNWLRTTDAVLTFTGTAKGPLAKRSALNTRVVYCNRRSGHHLPDGYDGCRVLRQRRVWRKL